MSTLKNQTVLIGQLAVPGDKSITHRAVMFNAVSVGKGIVVTTILGRDNFATIRIMRQLGVEISGSVTKELHQIAMEEGLTDFKIASDDFSTIKITGRGFGGLTQPKAELCCGNSGTTARLLTGLLAGRPFTSVFNGDHSLVKRPFKRVTEPLSKMGASFSSEKMPFTLAGGELRGGDFISASASAQVKSAIILAGLQAKGDVSITEPRLSRDHTERMLKAMGCNIQTTHLAAGSVKILLPDTPGRGILKSQDITVPGDFSAAAFFLVAGSVFQHSELVLKNVGVNPTRTGLYHVLLRMGARFELLNSREVCGEEVADIRVKAANLHAVDVDEKDVVLSIDEIPILIMAAALAHGTTRIRGAGELRVKESDRLSMSASILDSFGIKYQEHDDGIDIEGNPSLCFENLIDLKDNLKGASWKISGDHRIAMCGAIMELFVTGDFELKDVAAVETSFPRFSETLRDVIVK